MRVHTPTKKDFLDQNFHLQRHNYKDNLYVICTFSDLIPANYDLSKASFKLFELT